MYILILVCHLTMTLQFMFRCEGSPLVQRTHTLLPSVLVQKHADAVWTLNTGQKHFLPVLSLPVSEYDEKQHYAKPDSILCLNERGYCKSYQL